MDYDDSIVTIIDSDSDMGGSAGKPNASSSDGDDVVMENDSSDLPQPRATTDPDPKEDWLKKHEGKWMQRRKRLCDELEQTEKEAKELSAECESAIKVTLSDLRKLDIEAYYLSGGVNNDIVDVDEIDEQVKEDVDDDDVVVDIAVDVDDELEKDKVDLSHSTLPLSSRILRKIKLFTNGPSNKILITKFHLHITRHDIQTLLPNRWLNDEVINFYMNLLTERSNNSHSLPRVYAMNTFFMVRLLKNGQPGVRRWTRKVNIFSMDILPIPVHVNGMHWCMAIIDLRDKSIKYYDSLLKSNPVVLDALLKYIRDESLDKLKRPYDTSNFTIKSVRDVPRQFNVSDCGVFTCMFAEYITRNKKLTFAQKDMDYFRNKMIYEICTGALL